MYLRRTNIVKYTCSTEHTLEIVNQMGDILDINVGKNQSVGMNETDSLIQSPFYDMPWPMVLAGVRHDKQSQH